MEAVFTVRLNDLLSGPAKQMRATLQDVAKTAGEATKESAKGAADKVKASTQATADAAKSSAKTIAEATKAAAQAAIKPTEKSKAEPAKGIVPFSKDKGDVPAASRSAEPKSDTPADEKSKADKPGKGGGTKLGLADLPQEAGDAAGKATGIVGAAVALAKQRVAMSVGQSLADRLGQVSNDYIATKTQELLDPIRQQLDGLKTDFPALAPAIDAVQGKIETLSFAAANVAGNLATRLATSIGGKVGAMAAGLIGLPGILLGGAVLVMANWTRVKTFMGEMFNKLPEGARTAMTRMANYLAQTPIGALARGFDGMASYVESVFDALVNGGEQRWEKLKQLLITNPMQWVSGSWDALKSYFSNLWETFKANPREAIAGLGSSILSAVKSGLSGLASLGSDIVSMIRNADWAGIASSAGEMLASGIKGALSIGNWIIEAVTGINLAEAGARLADQVVTAIKEIPGKLSGLAEQIIAVFSNINLFKIGEEIIDSLLNGLKAGFAKLIAWLENKAGEIAGKIKGMMPSLPSWAGGTGGAANAPSIPGRAIGGPVQAGGLYKVGENGEELFVPGQDGHIINAADTRRLLTPAGMPASADAPSLFARPSLAPQTTIQTEGARTSSTVNHFNVVVHGAPNQAPEEFARKMWDDIETRLSGVLHDGANR